ATPVLHDVSVDGVPAGKVTAVIGPNAAGKTTLFKCIAGLLRGEGRITLDEQPLTEMRREAVTGLVAYLPQESPSTAARPRFAAVLRARQQGSAWRVRDDDLARVSAILAELAIDHLALRYLTQLSGGQRQLVSIAQALVREPRLLLMDEPTSSLDLQRQLEVLDVVEATAAERGIAAIVALHDLNLAIRYADHFLVMSAGRLSAAGDP